MSNFVPEQIYFVIRRSEDVQGKTEISCSLIDDEADEIVSYCGSLSMTNKHTLKCIFHKIRT